jgi:hypothetical protein
MRARATDTAEPVGAAVRGALAAPARGLAGVERALLESRLGGDLGALRIHTGPEVDRAADRLGARGFALGRHAALSSAARPDTLAHEAAHALQQGMAEPRGIVPVLPADAAPEREAQAAARDQGPVTAGHAPFLGRDLTSPGRLGEVHHGVRVEGPSRPNASGTPTPRLPWVDGPVGDANSTADLLFNQIFNWLDIRTFSSQLTGPTTAANLDADAVAMNQRVTAHFPQIGSPLNDAEVQARVGLVSPAAVRADPQFLNDWMDNFIEQMSDADQYLIDRTNANYRAMISRLISDPNVGPKIETLAARQPGFATGQGRSRQVFVHARVSASRRQLTLIHELVHLYRHDTYRAWVNASLDARHYDEGLTEWLAQRVMTPTERSARSGNSGYAGRVADVERQITTHVSVDGVARAYFAGEVWRVETRSARRAPPSARRPASSKPANVGKRLPPRAPRRAIPRRLSPANTIASSTSGWTRPTPRQEHVDTFRTLKRDRLDPEPTRGVRFVGHASSPGGEAHNMALARRRAVAFYRMAQREGVSRTRLVDVARPPHFGESLPSVTEEDVLTRAMNRRVEMFLIDGAAP